jgi:CDP-glucose 4,6-dehydratase
MLGVTDGFWTGRPVLVTGHTGFKGGWLCLWLEALKANVSGYALAPPTTPSLFEVAGVGNGLRHHIGDLRDQANLEQVMQTAAPEVVFHLAAQPLVRESYRDPVGTITSNVIGTMNVLEAVRRQPSVKAVVVVTSDKCYLNREWLWPYRENEALGGKDPYSASKACTELLTAAWRDTFLANKVSIATARAGNVIGGGDWAVDRLVPDALRAWQAGEVVQVRYPDAIRPWQHVLEPLAGYLQLARRLFDGNAVGAWNFGPLAGDSLSVADLLDQLAATWGEGARWKADPASHPSEAGLLRLDSSQARAQFGWRSYFNCREALIRVVDWHRAWLSRQDMRQFSVNQLLEYMEHADHP